MKKIKLLHTFLISFTALLSACSVDEAIEQQINDKQITMFASDFKSANASRTSINVTPDGGKFTWAENDTVGIFPNEGAQAYFPMTNGAGTNTAYFNGGGWALKPTYNYAAYYPYDYYNRNMKSIPVNYINQTQVGNASSAHLGKYDYMAAVAKTPENGKVTFNFEHLGALVRLLITLPKAGTYTNVTLTCNKAVFPLSGKVDITSSKPKFIATGTNSNQLKIKLQNFVTTKDKEIVTIYFMTAPVDLTGKVINVSVDGSTSYKGLVKIGNLVAGIAYSLNVVDTSRPPYDKTLWVDLGLPSGILWAIKNIGATNPEDYGDYFAWGETLPKSSYFEYNNATYNKPMTDFSGDPQYDAATANWGAPSRMPKLTEIQELANHCTITWTKQNGVNGRLVTGPNGNTIFLPAAGIKCGTFHDFAEEWGDYWTSTPDDNDVQNNFARRLSFAKKSLNWDTGNREYGRSIRPVQE